MRGKFAWRIVLKILLIGAASMILYLGGSEGAYAFPCCQSCYDDAVCCRNGVFARCGSNHNQCFEDGVALCTQFMLQCESSCSGCPDYTWRCENEVPNEPYPPVLQHQSIFLSAPFNVDGVLAAAARPVFEKVTKATNCQAAQSVRVATNSALERLPRSSRQLCAAELGPALLCAPRVARNAMSRR